MSKLFLTRMPSRSGGGEGRTIQECKQDGQKAPLKSMDLVQRSSLRVSQNVGCMATVGFLPLRMAMSRLFDQLDSCFLATFWQSYVVCLIVFYQAQAMYAS